MMQNDDIFIEMAQKNHQRYSYTIQKEQSRRNVKTKKKINFRGFVISIALGTIIASSMFMSFVKTETIDEKNINNTPTTSIETRVSYVQQESDIVSEEELFLKKYCNEVYGLNYETTKLLAIKLTNNFTSEEYKETNNPAFKINGRICNSKEEGFLTFARHLSQIPSDFGLTENEIRNTEFISPSKGNEEYKVKYYSDIFGIDPSLVLAIEYQEASESGLHYNSSAYLEYNNSAGLISPSTSKLWEFKSPDEGIIEHIYQLKKNYIDKGLRTPEAIKSTYAPDGALNDPTNLNHNWLSGVNYFMEEIKNNPNIFDNKKNDNDVSKLK